MKVWNAKEKDPEWPFDIVGAPGFKITKARTALVIIDVQNGYLKKNLNLENNYRQLSKIWDERVREKILPNHRRLLDFFRSRNLKISYTRNGNLTSSGDELTPRLKALWKECGKTHRRGLEDHDIPIELAPREQDLVVDKLTSCAFHQTCLDHALRNMGVTDLVITGIFTDMCVLGSARVASELGYNTLICEDACGAMTMRAHDEALLMHARRFGRVATTDEVLEELS